MNSYIIKQHLFRAWRRHWPLQVASITVMTVVLVIMNLLFLGFSSFNHMVGEWGQGLEMIVYLREEADSRSTDELKQKLKVTGDFEQIQFVSKSDATKKFLTAMGQDSLELLSDPKWKSPIPASFELQLSQKIPLEDRVGYMKGWAVKFQKFAIVDDVFYGQGWVENFSRFLHSARGIVGLTWILSLTVGLLIVSNCIRLSFLQRRDEIAVLELVGATAHFIRTPFLLEGFTIGLLASLCSLLLSFVLHTALLSWIGSRWDFWLAIQQIPAMKTWYIFANLSSGVAFGVLGAWNCVRKLNTGWAAVG